MSTLAQSVGRVDRERATRARRGYVVEVASNWTSVGDQWTGAATPFQDAMWLTAWYRMLGARPGFLPVLVTGRDGATGEVAVRLPFILRRRLGLDVIEFADLHLTDYNAPALGPAAPIDRKGAEALWRDIRRALPRADLLRLTKMPRMLGERPNPLALLPHVSTSALNGNVVRTGDDWMAWRRSLEKPVRKELERCWRVFSRSPGAAFEILTDPDRLRSVVAALEVQQEQRMRAKGNSYILDEPHTAQFYRDIIDHGVPTGRVVVSALTAGEEVIASLLGVCDGERYIMIRISNAGGRWTNCSPGRLIIERTMAALHAQGYRVFDLSVGNYPYKRRFGVQPVALVDLIEASSFIGMLGRCVLALKGLRDRYRRMATLIHRVRR